MSARHRRGRVLRRSPLTVACIGLWMLGVAGCAGGSAQQVERKTDEVRSSSSDGSEAGGSGARRVKLGAAVVAKAKRRNPLAIDRGALDRLLRAGPGALLQVIPLQPVMAPPPKRRFLGFRIVQIYDNSPRVLRYGVRPGDMLSKVNGQRVARPEDLMEVFRLLRNATEVQVEVKRDGKVLNFTFPIVQTRRPPRSTNAR